jgi:DNA-binding MarR family transcriptional regulator
MSDSIGFLLGDVSRLMRRRFDERARSIGVTRPQWRALTALSRAEGINQGALAERLEVEAITLCRMIDRLEEAGLVERRRAPADRRAWHIYLTSKSRPLLDQLRELGAELSDRALSGVSENQRHEMTAMLETIRANLQHPGDDTRETAHG